MKEYVSWTGGTGPRLTGHCRNLKCRTVQDVVQRCRRRTSDPSQVNMGKGAFLLPLTVTGSEPKHLVHGSLARAGKVKSQTPKVDKQEKKKTPKGRAKKRLLYNRRCVVLCTLCMIGRS